MPSHLSYKEQLESTAAAFASHLERKIALIESTWLQLIIERTGGLSLKTSSLQFMSDLAHELHGQGVLFGYPDVSRIAGSLEEIVELLIKSSIVLSIDGQSQISSLIDELKEASTNGARVRETLFSNRAAITAIDDYKRRPLQSDQPGKILIIEDIGVTRKHIATGLRLAGYDVFEAHDGQSGISLAIKHMPGLILLDIKMPDIDGFEVQKKLRTHDDLCDIPLIFLTSLNRVSIAQIKKSISYGVADYIAKPFNMSRLIEKVKNHLS